MRREGDCPHGSIGRITSSDALVSFLRETREAAGSRSQGIQTSRSRSIDLSPTMNTAESASMRSICDALGINSVETRTEVISRVYCHTRRNFPATQRPIRQASPIR